MSTPLASKSLPVATRDVAEARQRGAERAALGRELRLEIPVARRAERQALFFAIDDQAGRRRSARGRRSARSAPSSTARATACSRTADRECGGFPGRGPDSRRRRARPRPPALIASSVISWKTIRLTGTFGFRTSFRCQLIDSPSRSGSVASTGLRRALQRRLQRLHVLALVVRDDVVRLEVAVGVDAEAAPLLLADFVGDLVGRLRQIADVPVARLDLGTRSPRSARSSAPSPATRRSPVSSPSVPS